MLTLVPEDVLHLILKKLNSRDLFSISRTSKYLYNHSKEEFKLAEIKKLESIFFYNIGEKENLSEEDAIRQGNFNYSQGTAKQNQQTLYQIYQEISLKTVAGYLKRDAKRLIALYEEQYQKLSEKCKTPNSYKELYERYDTVKLKLTNIYINGITLFIHTNKTYNSSHRVVFGKNKEVGSKFLIDIQEKFPLAYESFDKMLNPEYDHSCKSEADLPDCGEDMLSHVNTNINDVDINDPSESDKDASLPIFQP